MKTKTWLALFALLLIFCTGASVLLLNPGEAATHATITSDGRLLHRVNLSIDQTFRISSPQGGENTVTVRDGKIAVTEATCPDHYCMQRGFCDRGTQIVCLPNRLVIAFTAPQEIDAVAG